MFAPITAFALAATLASAAPLTIEDCVTMPQLSSPRISPDGTRVVYVVTRADLARSAYNADIWTTSIAGSGTKQLTRSDATDNSPQWSPDAKRIAFLSDRSGPTSIYLMSPDGGEPLRLTNEPTGIRSFEWSADGRSIAFTRAEARTPQEESRAIAKDDAHVVGEDRKHVHLHVIDVETRRVRRVTEGGFSVFEFSWSPRGDAFAIVRTPGTGLDEQYRSDLYLVAAGGGELRPLVVRPGIDRGPVWSPDAKTIAFVSTGGVYDWLKEHDLHVVPSAGGKPRAVSASYDRIAEAYFWSDDGTSLVFEGPLDLASHLFNVSAIDEEKVTQISRGDVLIEGLDLVKGRAAFVMQSLTAPPEIFISSITNFEPRQLTHHNDAYRSRALGETKVIRWKNPKDGLQIEGLLTLPIGYRAGEKVPLLVHVHGGPASRFDFGFLGYGATRYPTHVFAAAGYAVLRPNPRGTGGYGGAFRAANRNDWGGMDWIDINAGIDALIEQGIADPARLGLMGWSYGGFIAAHAIGASDRLAAISVGAAVVDLLSFHGTTDIRDFIPFYFDQRDPRPDPALDALRRAPLSLDLLRAHSPLWHLKRTKAKVLIQHGEADDRVPLSQGTMLYRLLDELGVDVTMVIYPRSGHSPREPKLRMDVARRNLELFTKTIRR
ncbi:MAG: S9 family peptidase [Thermoanaerobaculia bacterium]